MLTITDGVSLSRALTTSIDPRLKQLLTDRIQQLDVEDLSTAARFIIVQPGDTLDDLEKELGFLIAGDHERGFDPEWVADHGTFYEAVWILTDDGFAHVVLVPREPGISPDLLDFCATYASEQAVI